MKKEDLTLCLICKNEENGLKRAVDSALPYVREVIIGVDNESYDNTLDIARSLTPNVFIFQFNNDFSYIRNAIQKCAKTSFVLWLDGHEYLDQPIDFSEFSDIDVDGYLIRTKWDGGFELIWPKILRKDVLYVGAIHEQPQLKRPQTLLKPYIVHDRVGGQDPESIRIKNEQREKMMNELMAAELKKNKKNLHALFQMAIYRQGTGKTKEACRLYEKYIEYQPKDNTNFLVYLNLGLCQIELGRLRDAERTLRRGLGKCGKMWEFNFILGAVLSQRKKHKDAIAALVASLEPNTLPQMYFPFRRQLSNIWDMIASNFAALGDRNSAFVAWNRAAELAPDDDAKKRYMLLAAHVDGPTGAGA